MQRLSLVFSKPIAKSPVIVVAPEFVKLPVIAETVPIFDIVAVPCPVILPAAPTVISPMAAISLEELKSWENSSPVYKGP